MDLSFSAKLKPDIDFLEDVICACLLKSFQAQRIPRGSDRAWQTGGKYLNGQDYAASLFHETANLLFC